MAYITLPNWSMRLHLDVSVHSQSIANNTTTFRALLRVQDPYNNWPHNLNANSMSWSVRSPNGTVHRSGSGTFDFRNYEWLTLSDTHITFGHNADGSFTARQWTGHFSNSGPIGSGVVTINSVSAPTIPRATTPSWSGNFVTGTAKSISLPRPASSGFTHDVAYRFGTSGNYTNIATGAGDTTTWNPGHALASNFPNATYGTGQIRVITKSGSTTVGTKTESFRVNAAGSIVPTISSVTWDDSNPNVKSLVGAFVQGQSLVKGSVTAAGAHGSTIKAADRTLIIGGQTLRESDLWQPTTAGTITASGRVLDSRSRVGTLAANFEVLPYSPPSINNGLTIVRRATNSEGAVGEGSFLRMDLTAAVSSLKPSTAEKNTFHLRVRTRPVGGAWTTRNNGVLSGLTKSAALIMVKDGAAFPTATSFEVEIRVTDALGNYSEVIRRVATAAVTLDLADTGIGVGKIWERGGLDVQGDIYANGNRVPDITQLTSMWHVNRQTATGRTAFGTREATTPYGAGETALMLYPVGDSTGGAFAVMKDGSSSSNVLMRLMDNGDLNIQGRVIEGDDSGWQTLSLASGITYQERRPQWRRIGNKFYLRGDVRKTSGSHTTSYAEICPPGAIPDLPGLRDAYNQTRIVPGPGAVSPGRMYFNGDGGLWLATTGGTSSYYMLNSEYLLDL